MGHWTVGPDWFGSVFPPLTLSRGAGLGFRHGRDGLLIGEVAARSGVSRKALRLYEEAGIRLGPVSVPLAVAMFFGNSINRPLSEVPLFRSRNTARAAVTGAVLPIYSRPECSTDPTLVWRARARKVSRREGIYREIASV